MFPSLFDNANLWFTLTDPFADPTSRTWLGALAIGAVVGLIIWRRTTDHSLWQAPLVFGAWLRTRAWSKSGRLDISLLLFRQILAFFGLAIPAIAIATWFAQRGVILADRTLGTPPSELWLPDIAVVALYTLTLFVVQDASRFVLHALMHRVPTLWQFHQVHHSAEVLTPLTFHRIHPVESALYAVRGIIATTVVAAPAYWLFREHAVVWTLFGVHGLGLLLNAVAGNLRHSEIWWSFGPTIERWLISPAQHQLHHGDESSEHPQNLGTWLSIWDRLYGSLRLAGPTPPPRFGLKETERNHAHTLTSALVGPFLGAIRYRPMRLTALLSAIGLSLLGSTRAKATEAEEAERAEESDDFEVIVEVEGELPRVAGSAHVVTEKELERFEMDDVGRVLATVPGVYIRDEDGQGLRPNIGIRGASSQRSAKITLLEDGIPFAPAPYAAPAAYFFPLLTRMTAMEVVKGPAAIQHGPNTVGGTVNLKTRSVPRDGLDAAIDTSIGNYTSGKAHAWLGGGDQRGGWLIEGVHLGTRGFWNPDVTTPVGTRRSEVMAKGRINTTNSGDSIQLKLTASQEDSRATYLGLHGDDFAADPLRRYGATSEARLTSNRLGATLGYQGQMGEDRSFRVSAYGHRLTRSWRKFNGFAGATDPHAILTSPDSGRNASWLALLRGLSDSLTEDERAVIGTNERVFTSGGLLGTLRSSWRASDDSLIDSARGEFGIRLHYDHVQRFHTEEQFDLVAGTLVDRGQPVATTRDDVSTAAALSAHTAWGIRTGSLSWEPGFRLETVHTAVDGKPDGAWRIHPLPGFGARWQPTDSIALFAGVYRGLSPVAPGQAPETRAETAWNSEAGLRALIGPGSIELTGFLSDYANLTGECSFASGCTDDAVGDQFSAGAVQVGGVEFAGKLEAPLGRGWSAPVGVNVTWTESRFRDSFQSSFPLFGSVEAGDYLPYVPRAQGAAQLGLSHPRGGLFGSVEWASAQLDAAGPTTEAQLPGRTLVHLSAQAHLHEQITLYGTVQNALNSQVQASLRPYGARPVGPRLLTLGVKGRR